MPVFGAALRQVRTVIYAFLVLRLNFSSHSTWVRAYHIDHDQLLKRYKDRTSSRAYQLS